MDIKPRAILVSVNYHDYLSITLPYNQKHFESVMVVTSFQDKQTQELASYYDVDLFVTDAFYDDGAYFNKWKALEQGLDAYGRYGWMCIMDADVLWPKHHDPFKLTFGNLYTPFRRMLETFNGEIPAEYNWEKYPRHRQQTEFAGFTQVFHADDPVLGDPPWHQTNWKHAGGADSFFQAKWPKTHKIRPNFEVLHLGPNGTNWCGRASSYLDGSKPEEASKRVEALNDMMKQRRLSRHAGGFTGDRFAHEKLSTVDTMPDDL